MKFFIPLHTPTKQSKSLCILLQTEKSHNIKIYIIADEKEAKFNRSVIPNLAAIKNINIYLLHGKNYKHGGFGKLHAKASIIDNKILITGSANYTYSAFYKNYEYVIFHKNQDLIKKFNDFFDYLKSKAKPYRLSR